MTIEPMDRTVLQTKDLSEQAQTGYILLPPPGEGIGYMAIDDWRIDAQSMQAFCDGKPVAVFPVRAEWRILDASRINKLTYEASMRLQASQMKASDALRKELLPGHPEMDPMQAIADALQQGAKSHPTGQYL